MCRLTEEGFRWQREIPLPMWAEKWYAYERAPGELRYSRINEPDFHPLYAIRIKAKQQQQGYC